MTRNLLLVCAGLIVALTTAYALTETYSRADFTYVNPSGIHTLDPVRMSWTTDFRVALNIWEGLTSWGPRTNDPVAGAAEFPPAVSGDGLTYTFTIRSDARWSNGDPVTAEDFVRGWRRALEPGSATDYTFLVADTVAGAADYVRWRRDGVALLTGLARLRDGWAIDATLARSLAQAATTEAVRDLVRKADVSLTTPADDPKWAALAETLGRARIAWASIYDQSFAAHAAEFDERFARIGVTAVGERILRVRLARPCPYFLDLTGFPVFLPCHRSIEAMRLRYREAPFTEEGLVVYDPQWTKPVSRSEHYPGLITNGPYRLAEWHFKRRARLEVNPFYHSAESIACRTVDMLVYDSVNAAIMAYEAGSVDFLPDMSVPYAHEIARLARSGERSDFHLCAALATYFFNFNCASETVLSRPNPFLDSRVRKAFALAIDKRGIVENVLQQGDRIARTFVPPDAIAGYVSPTGLSRDVDAARRLLASAGYPDGRGLPPIDLLYTPNDERVCQAVARMWTQELGARVELRCKETKTFAQDKADHRFMIARANWYADYNDPTTFLDCLTSQNGNNDSGYASASYDRLLDQARNERDPRARAALLRRAESMIVEDDLPILPILHYVSPIAIKGYVKGLHPNPRFWFPFRFVTVNR